MLQNVASGTDRQHIVPPAKHRSGGTSPPVAGDDDSRGSGFQTALQRHEAAGGGFVGALSVHSLSPPAELASPERCFCSCLS